jgi:hypothetical protein
MPILTKASITKGTPAVFTLDKNELALQAAVVADAYFSDMANWKYVSITYKGSISTQKKIVLFDISTDQLTAPLKTSLFAEDIFLVDGVTIHDFDGGKLLLPRSLLLTTEFDIDMGVISAFYTRDFSSPSTLLANESGIIVNSLLELGQNGYELNSQPIVYEVGVTYKVRVHINSFISGSLSYFLVAISPFNQQANVIFEYDNAVIVGAVGSYLEGSFVATSAMNVNPYKIMIGAALAAMAAPLSIRVSKIEIIKV